MKLVSIGAAAAVSSICIAVTLFGGCGSSTLSPSELAQAYRQTEKNYCGFGDMETYAVRLRERLQEGFPAATGIPYYTSKMQAAKDCGVSQEALEAADGRFKSDEAYKRQVQQELLKIEPILSM